MSRETMAKTKELVTVKKADLSDEPELHQGCRHHWLIESVAGPISQGVCQLCGMKRDFDNYLTGCLKGNKEPV